MPKSKFVTKKIEKIIKDAVSVAKTTPKQMSQMDKGNREGQRQP